jgi:hypothetical protein
MHLEEVLRQHNVDVSSLSLPEYQRAREESPVYLLRLPAIQALTHWEVLRNLVPETGYWPVIGWDRLKQPPWEEEPVQDILEVALRINAQQWFAQQWFEQYGENMAYWEDRANRDADQTSAHFAFLLHLRRFSWALSPLAPVVLVPTTAFWEVPAYISIQANEWDPPDAVHVALLKYWNERWKAELVSMVSGLIEMRVLQPPTTFQEAFELAKEHYLYAPDVVDQWLGGNLNTLARMLLNGHVWRFWWD